MRNTTGLSKKAIATAIAKRLESNTRTGGTNLYNARDKFRRYREVSEHNNLSVDTFKDSPIINNKLNFFNKKSLISVVESLQEETLSARKINQYDTFISSGEIYEEREESDELLSFEYC